MKKFFTILGVSTAFLATAQTNLMVNPGFESWTAGTPDGWYVTGMVVVQNTTDFHGGASSLGLTAPAPTGTATSANKTTNQIVDIPVTEGVTYVWSGWYLDNTPNAQFRWWNQWRSATGDLGANSLQGADYSVDSPAWVFFTAEGMPNAGALTARPGLRVYGNKTANGGIVYFDDVMFYDKASMAVTDVKAFDKQVKMNTNVGNALTVILPARATVNIFTAEGKLVSSNRIDSGQSINTSSLAKGMYIVTVDNGTAKVSRKVMKN